MILPSILSCMCLAFIVEFFCHSHSLEPSHRKHKAGKCALKTRKGEASPPRLYMLQIDLDKVTPTPPQGTGTESSLQRPTLHLLMPRYRKSITSTPGCFDRSKVNMDELTGTFGFKFRIEIPTGSDSFRTIKLALTGSLVVGSNSSWIDEKSESGDLGVNFTTSNCLPFTNCVPR